MASVAKSVEESKKQLESLINRTENEVHAYCVEHVHVVLLAQAGGRVLLAVTGSLGKPDISMKRRQASDLW